MEKANIEKAKQVEEVYPSGYVITISEVWTKDRKRGYWIAKDTGGRTVHAETAELAVKRLRRMFWDDTLKAANRNRNA